MNWKRDLIRPWAILSLPWFLVTGTLMFNNPDPSRGGIALIVAVPLGFLGLGCLGFWVAGRVKLSDSY
jgi:hypothetical protein